MRISDWSSTCALPISLLHHVDDAAEFIEAHAGLAGDIGNLDADALDRVGFLFGEGGPFLVLARVARQPILFELVADIGTQEIHPLDLVALGQAQPLPSQRGPSAVEGIERSVKTT